MDPWARQPKISSRLIASLAGFGNGLDLFQHFLHPAADFFPLFFQLHSIATQSQKLIFAVFQLLPQPLRVTLRRRLRLPRRFVHLYGAVNFLFERLKIIRRNLLRHLLDCVQRHKGIPHQEFRNFSAVYSESLWTNPPILRPKWATNELVRFTIMLLPRRPPYESLFHSRVRIVS